MFFLLLSTLDSPTLTAKKKKKKVLSFVFIMGLLTKTVLFELLFNNVDPF